MDKVLLIAQDVTQLRELERSAVDPQEELNIISNILRIHVVEAQKGRSIMQAAWEVLAPYLIGECGGSCICASCHACIDFKWLGALPPVSRNEAAMLAAIECVRYNSRLTCQLILGDSLTACGSAFHPIAAEARAELGPVSKRPINSASGPMGAAGSPMVDIDQRSTLRRELKRSSCPEATSDLNRNRRSQPWSLRIGHIQ